MTATPHRMPWHVVTRPGPVLATAIHAGHTLRDSLVPYMKLSPDQRLRDEAPFTDRLAPSTDTLICSNVSRFEVDLNRERSAAVYAGPDTAWGLDVWREPLPDSEIARSINLYDLFYDYFEATIRARLREMPRVLVLDIRSSDHRRDGPEDPATAQQAHPTIRVGTEAADRTVWGESISKFLHELQSQRLDGRPIDALENVNVKSGHLSHRVAQAFGSSVLVLSIQFKKVFVDEPSGQPDADKIQQLQTALSRAVDAVRPLLHASRGTAKPNSA